MKGHTLTKTTHKIQDMNYNLILLHHSTTKQHTIFKPWEQLKILVNPNWTSQVLLMFLSPLETRSLHWITKYPLSLVFTEEQANPCWFPNVKRTLKEISSTQSGFCQNITFCTKIALPLLRLPFIGTGYFSSHAAYSSAMICFTGSPHPARPRILYK